MRIARSAIARAAAAVLLLWLGLWPGVSAAQVDTCVSCHELEIDEQLALPVPEWRESIHATHEVSCDACHGGDPQIEDADESMSDAAGFQEVPGWLEMADHCGYCHEELAKSFDIGAFGRRMREGERVATCATCHMQDGHRIVLADPNDLRTQAVCPSCPTVSDLNLWNEMLIDTAESEAQVEGQVLRVEAKGIELADFRSELVRVHEDFARAVHTFEEEELAQASLAATVSYNALLRELKVLGEEADQRRRLGFALLGALGLLFAALVASQRLSG